MEEVRGSDPLAPTAKPAGRGGLQPRGAGPARVCLEWNPAPKIHLDSLHHSAHHSAYGRWVRKGICCRCYPSATVYTLQASTWNFAVHAPYTVGGFYAPVDKRPTVNLTSAGSAVPVRFSLGGNQGLGVFARSYPGSGKIDCDSTAPIDAIEQTVTASTSGLTYSTGTGQYTYTWKTQKSWGGTCRQLEFKFNDGSVLTANFKFR